jgi:magnesium chelatase subunit D
LPTYCKKEVMAEKRYMMAMPAKIMVSGVMQGIKALEPGILAAANRGILYIDEVNLLDDHVADVLLDSAAMGVNIVERECVSVAHPSKFILVGTMNPEEGEIRPQLMDRFGLQVSVVGIEDVDQRMQIAKMAESFDKRSGGLCHAVPCQPGGTEGEDRPGQESAPPGDHER